MMMQIIDIVGKLGPLIVAIAVYWLTRQQSAWNRLLGFRAAAMEDQKLRLALLERRLTAIESIREVYQNYYTNGDVTIEAVQKVYDALRVAELVFDRAEEQAIEAFRQLFLDWLSHDRKRARYSQKDDEKFHLAMDGMNDAGEKIEKALAPLLDRLRNATRVEMPFQIPMQSSRWPIFKKNNVL